MGSVARLLRSLRAPGAGYYQRKHSAGGWYTVNNWLVREVDAILAAKPGSVLEVGCGNGRFLAAIKPHVASVTGVDWARSPMIDKLGLAENFRQLDIAREKLPKADVVCSADVLEHIKPGALPLVLRKLHAAGPHQYHVIACYDDGHSHLSIMGSAEWLGRFAALSPLYRLVETRARKPHKPVCVIANYQISP